MAQTRTW